MEQEGRANYGYPGCRPYAEAVGNGGEKINRCAPGGEAVMLKIAELLNVDPQPTDGDDDTAEPVRMLAVIDEPNCIGCTKCIQACPVDAIIGATRAMHTVVEDLCTGCNLCVAPCPTQCIELRPVGTTTDNWKWDWQTFFQGFSFCVERFTEFHDVHTLLTQSWTNWWTWVRHTSCNLQLDVGLYFLSHSKIL
jgi:RnfABCDGE-type electron transport complex B subunit